MHVWGGCYLEGVNWLAEEQIIPQSFGIGTENRNVHLDAADGREKCS